VVSRSGGVRVRACGPQGPRRITAAASPRGPAAPRKKGVVVEHRRRHLAGVAAVLAKVEAASLKRPRVGGGAIATVASDTRGERPSRRGMAEVLAGSRGVGTDKTSLVNRLRLHTIRDFRATLQCRDEALDDSPRWEVGTAKPDGASRQMNQ